MQLNDFGLFFCFCFSIINMCFSCNFDSTNLKGICGCRKYPFMNQQGKQAYCGKTRDYYDIFQQSKLPRDVISISLSQNEIKYIPENFFPSEISETLRKILELSLGENEIEFIADNAFHYFENLTSLNLTYNRIGRLRQGMFRGLKNLQRLYLSYNKFPIIPGDTFVDLVSIRKLEVLSDYLICNCLMKDFLAWFRTEKAKPGRRLKLTGKCRLPVDKKDQLLRTVAKNYKDLTCDQTTSLSFFEISPSSNRVVFSGDRVILYCEGFDLSASEVSWSLNGMLINATTESFSETSLLHHNKSTIASYVDLKLSPDWSGQWECAITSNYSRDSRRVNLTVLEKSTQYCHGIIEKNDFGVFKWPEVVTGAEILLDCGVKTSPGFQKTPLKAKRVCLNDGVWSDGDYGRCHYVDPVARMLANMMTQDFNQSAINLCNQTSVDLLRYKITASVGFKYLVQFLKKCRYFLLQSNSIASSFVKISSRAMDAPTDIIVTSQHSYKACDVIDDVILRVVQSSAKTNVTIFNQNTANIALQTLIGETDAFCNISISNTSTSVHCADEQGSAKFAPSIHIPVQKNDAQFQLALVIYRNGQLFQHSATNPTISLERYQQDKAVYNASYISADVEAMDSNSSTFARPVVLVSSVYSVLPLNATELAFSKQMILIFHTEENVSLRKDRHYVVVWSGNQWQRMDAKCQFGPKKLESVLHSRNITVLKCKQTGIYAIAKNLNDPPADSSHATSIHLMHFSVYIGSSVLLLCLCLVIITYLIFPNLLISRESRHMLINLCSHLSLVLLAYVLGVGRVENEILCYSSGVAIHYSSLAVLAWLLLIARIMGKEMVASQQPPPSEPKPKRPMLRFYLIACGIPVMICGITAAANIQNYHEDNEGYCWLTWDTSLYAFFVPAALTAVTCVLILLRILATLNCYQADGGPEREPHSDHNQATEITPLHQTSSRQLSTLTLQKQIFNEQSFGVRLRGAATTLLFFIVTWICAAFSVAAPHLQESSSEELTEKIFDKWISLDDQEAENYLSVIFSYLFAALSCGMGVFLLYQYVLSRADVTMHWKRLLRCKRVLSSDGCHGNAIELVPKMKQKNATNISVTEELTLETVAPGTTGEENSLPPSTGGASRLRSTSHPIIVKSISNKYPNYDQNPTSSNQQCNRNHTSHQGLGKTTVKLTNLQGQAQLHLPLHESSLTEHSYDEAQANMHTIPVVLQHNTVKIDNSVLYSKYQKIKKSREAKRKRRQKLTVLREYAHDPLTSNDESGVVKSKQRTQDDSSTWDFNDLDVMDEKMKENLAINEYKKAEENERLNLVDPNTGPLRPLLISSPHRENDRPRSHRERPNRDANIATDYKPVYSDIVGSSHEPLQMEFQSIGPSTHPSNRSEGLDDSLRTGFEEKSPSSQSHGYLTASAILSNSFHVPIKKSSSVSTSQFFSTVTPAKDAQNPMQ